MHLFTHPKCLTGCEHHAENLIRRCGHVSVSLKAPLAGALIEVIELIPRYLSLLSNIHYKRRENVIINKVYHTLTTNRAMIRPLFQGYLVPPN